MGRGSRIRVARAAADAGRAIECPVGHGRAGRGQPGGNLSATGRRYAKWVMAQGLIPDGLLYLEV